MRHRIIVSFVAVCSAFAAAAQDQGLRNRDPELTASKRVVADLQRANFHRGPFYLLSQFRISDAGYTETLMVPTGDGDTGLSLSVEAPQRLYFVPAKKTIFSLDLVPGYSILGTQAKRNQFNYLGRADAHFLLNHLYLDAYTSRADQLRGHVGDLNRLATTRVNETGVAGEIKYSSRTSAIFNVFRRDFEFPEDRYQPEFENADFNPVQLLDRDEKSIRASAAHKTFPLTSLFLSAEASDYGFRYATFKDSRRLWYGGGARFDSGRTQMSAELAALRLSFDDRSQKQFRGFGGRVSAVRKNGRWQYDAGASRDVGFSVFAENNYYITTMGNAGLSYEANRRLLLRAGSVYERQDYDVAVRGRLRRDTASFSSVGFLFRVRRLQLGVDAGWYERESTHDVDPDSGIRYVLHLSLTP